MQVCETHDKCVVVFNGNGCPLCKAETIIKNIWEELEKSMGILREIKRAGGEAGLKIS